MTGGGAGRGRGVRQRGAQAQWQERGAWQQVLRAVNTLARSQRLQQLPASRQAQVEGRCLEHL